MVFMRFCAFLQKFGAICVRIVRDFAQIFRKRFSDFQYFSPNFQEFCPDFRQIKTFEGVDPASCISALIDANKSFPGAVL